MVRIAKKSAHIPPGEAKGVGQSSLKKLLVFKYQMGLFVEKRLD